MATTFEKFTGNVKQSVVPVTKPVPSTTYNNNNNIIQKTKDTTVKLDFNPTAPVQPALKDIINKSKVSSASVGGIALSGTAVPQKVVQTTQDLLKLYGLDSTGYTKDLPPASQIPSGFSSSSKDTLISSKFYETFNQTDIFNTTTNTETTKIVDNTKPPSFWSTLDATVQKYVIFALIGIGLITVINVTKVFQK